MSLHIFEKIFRLKVIYLQSAKVLIRGIEPKTFWQDSSVLSARLPRHSINVGNHPNNTRII